MPPRYETITPGLKRVLARLRQGPLCTTTQRVCASADSLKVQVFHLRALGYKIDTRTAAGEPWAKGGGSITPSGTRGPGSVPATYHLISEPKESAA